MISVFTSSYNHGDFLSEAIESVLGQSYGDFEYHLIDDGSSDYTWDIIQSYTVQDARIRPLKVAKQANVGAVINISITRMKGGYWVWAPADDVLLPELLQRKADFAIEHPTAVLYSHGAVIDVSGEVQRLLQPRPVLPGTFRWMMRRQPGIGMTGIWIPRSAFDHVGTFPEHLDYSEDFYWVLKACKAGVDFVCVPEVLYHKRVHPNRTTERNWGGFKQQVQKIRRELQ